jgi:hypothetical protein
MKLFLIFVFLVLNLKVLSQEDRPTYPPMCADTIYVDTFMTGEPDRFFGGEDQLKKFLEVNVGKLVREDDAFSGQIILQVGIDTLGYIKDASIISGIDSCEMCNMKILDAIKRIRRWRPHCYYAIRENILVCKDRDFNITIQIENKKIHIK